VFKSLVKDGERIWSWTRCKRLSEKFRQCVRHSGLKSWVSVSWPPKAVPLFVVQGSYAEWHGNGIRMRMRWRYCARLMFISNNQIATRIGFTGVYRIKVRFFKQHRNSKSSPIIPIPNIYYFSKGMSNSFVWEFRRADVGRPFIIGSHSALYRG
jgi:hypothetical protein